MELYHGSPKKLRILKPQTSRGEEEFENQKAIFLTDSFTQAALYALGKTLKGKTCFALPPNKLVIVGPEKLKKAYVYKVNVEAEKGIWNQYVYNSSIKKFDIFEVNPKDYSKSILRLKNKEELIDFCYKEKRRWLKENGFCIPKLKFRIASLDSITCIFDRFLNPHKNEWSWQEKFFFKYSHLKTLMKNKKTSKERKKHISRFLNFVYRKERKNLEKMKKGFRKEWNRINDRFMIAISEIVEEKWPIEMSKITAKISLSPVCPRDLEKFSFHLYYKFKKDQMKAICMHEIFHFIYFKKWDSVFNNNSKIKDRLLKLHLSEIVPHIVLNDPKVQKILNYRHKTYKEYKNIKLKDKSLIEIIENLYYNRKNFKDFLKRIDNLIAKNRKTIIDNINKNEKNN